MRFLKRVDVLFFALAGLIFLLIALGLTAEQWSIASVCIGTPAFFIYNGVMIKQKKHSASSTWIVWVFLDWISLIGMFTKNELNGLVWLYTIGATVTCGIVLYRDGWSHWTAVDKWCTAIALLGIVLWQIVDRLPEMPFGLNGVMIGVGLAQVSGLIGTVPMWKHVWNNPYDESSHAWTIWAWSTIGGLLAVSEWTFVNAAAPVTFFIIEWNTCWIMFYRRKTTPPPKTS